MANTGWTDLPVSNVSLSGPVTIAQPVDVVIVGQFGVQSPFSVKNLFNQVAAVASGSTQPIVTYTVPVGKTSYLVRATFGGQNIATFSLILNGTPFDLKRTYFGSDLSESLQYSASPVAGYQLNAGDVMVLQVDNYRPTAADFEGALYVIEVG